MIPSRVRPPRQTAVLLSVSLVAALAACSKRDDGPRAAAVPPLEGQRAASAPPTPPPAPPAGAVHGEAAPPAAADPTPVLGGQIVLPAQHKGAVAAGDVLWLTVRQVPASAGERGTLLATKKLPAGPFPMTFGIARADMGHDGSGDIKGEVTVVARLDKDGDPMTRKKGDIVGTVSKVKVGARDLRVVLDTELKADEASPAPGAMPAGHGMPPGGMPPGHGMPSGGMPPAGGTPPGGLPPGHP